MSFVGQNPKFKTTALEDIGLNSTPNPPAGYHKLVNRGGAVKVRDSSGLESSLGGGSGELNLIENPSDSGSWSETGTVFATPATTTTAGDLPLGGIVDTAIQFVATGNGTEATDYNSYSFTTPASLSGKVKVEFYMRPGSGFSESQWTVSVYQSSTRQSLSTDSSNVTYLVNRTGKFTTTVDLLASTAYTLRFARVAGAGSATLNIANVIVGPGIQPQGAVVGEWQSYTPTFGAGFGTVSTQSFRYRRVGSVMEILGEFTVGTVAASPPSITLPLGTINTSLVQSGLTKLGEFNKLTSSSFTTTAATTAIGQKLGVIFYDSASGTSLVRFTTETSATPTFRTDNGNESFSTGDIVAVRATIPISEWSGSGTVNLAQNDVEYAYNTSTTDANDTTSFGYGPSGTTFPGSLTTGRDKRVRFLTPFQSGDQIVVELSQDQVKWFAASSGYIGSIANVGVWTPTTGVGVRAANVNSTDVDIYFSQYAISTTNWTTSGGYWRVKKVRAGAAVGFGIVQPGVSSGLVSASGLPGRTDGGTVASGYVGETVQGQQLTSTNFFGNNVFGDVTSVSLTAGKWSISAFMIMSLNGATSTGGQLGISTTSGNSSSGLTAGDNIGYLVPPTVSYDTHGSIPSYIVNISSTTTYYLKAVGYYSAGTPQYRGRLTAIRIA